MDDTKTIQIQIKDIKNKPKEKCNATKNKSKQSTR